MPTPGMRVLALLLALCGPGLAGAQVVDARATTLIGGRQDAVAGRVEAAVPVYELVSVHATGLSAPGVSDLQLHVSGWGALDLARLGDTRPASGDVDLAYAQGALLDRRLEVRLGRHISFGGAARPTQVDGATVTLNAWKGLGLSAFGGGRVVPRFAEGFGGGWLGGARAFWRRSYDAEIGVSFLAVSDREGLAREDVGVDGRWLAREDLALTAYVLYGLLDSRLAEANALASWQALRGLEVSLAARRTAPDLFLSRTSILWVFASESRDEYGGEVSYAPLRWLGLRGEARALDAPDGLGYRAGLRALARLGQDRRSQVGAEVRRLSVEENGYAQGRLFAAYRCGRLSVTGDLDAYRFDRQVNGADLSLTATGTVGMEVARGWTAMVAGLGGVTALLERRFEVIGRVAYTFGAPREEAAQ